MQFLRQDSAKVRRRVKGNRFVQRQCRGGEEREERKGGGLTPCARMCCHPPPLRRGNKKKGLSCLRSNYCKYTIVGLLDGEPNRVGFTALARYLVFFFFPCQHKVTSVFLLRSRAKKKWQCTLDGCAFFGTKEVTLGEVRLSFGPQRPQNVRNYLPTLPT